MSVGPLVDLRPDSSASANARHAHRSADQSAVEQDAVLGQRMRSALRLLPEPVAIVTTMCGGHAHGMIATAFSSVSVQPPQILICVNLTATSCGLIRESGRFAVNFLAREHQILAKRFAESGASADKRFETTRWLTLASGCPVLADAAAALDCVTSHCFETGTHRIFVGRVLAVLWEEREALLYRSGGYGGFHLEAARSA